MAAWHQKVAIDSTSGTGGGAFDFTQTALHGHLRSTSLQSLQHFMAIFTALHSRLHGAASSSSQRLMLIFTALHTHLHST
jgi:hypothetical protein